MKTTYSFPVIVITTQWTFSLNNWYSIECPATYLAEWIVWIIHDDHFCFAVELTRQLQRIKFPVSAGNEAALLVLYKQYLSFCRPTYGRSQTTSCPSIFYTFNISPPPQKKKYGVSVSTYLYVCTCARETMFIKCEDSTPYVLELRAGIQGRMQKKIRRGSLKRSADIETPKALRRGENWGGV